MFCRRLLTLVFLLVIWMIWKNFVFIESVTETMTEHPEWPAVKQHSKKLMQSATRVARDSLIEVLEDECRAEASETSQDAQFERQN